MAADNDWRKVFKCNSESEMIRELCAFVSSEIRNAIKDRQNAKIGISGGSLATFLEKGLVSEDIDWSKVHVFFCDERHVPFDDADSTYKIYAEKLFSLIKIPPENIHKINPNVSVEEAAQEYEKEMKAVFGSQLPQFDVLLLGMGPDGHTCSLFPNHPLLKENARWIAPIADSPKPPPRRITMTLPVVNGTRRAVFAAAGASKADMVQRIAQCSEPTEELPASLVRPRAGQVLWFLDAAAASKL